MNDGSPATRGESLDERLAQDLRAQRPGAIDALLAAYGRQIQGVAHLIVQSQSDAEEVLIDTLVKAWRKPDQLRDDTSLRPWLLRIATRHALSRVRRSRDVDPLWTNTPITTADTPDLISRLDLERALARLPPRTRAAVALHYLADLTVEQTAHVLGTRPNTIKTQLRIGTDRLRELLHEPDR